MIAIHTKTYLYRGACYATDVALLRASHELHQGHSAQPPLAVGEVKTVVDAGIVGVKAAAAAGIVEVKAAAAAGIGGAKTAAVGGFVMDNLNFRAGNGDTGHEQSAVHCMAQRAAAVVSG
jgi:hypothetical protein